MEGRRVVFFEVEPSEEQFFRDKLEHSATLVFHRHALSQDTLTDALTADYIASFIYSDFSREIIEKLPQLRAIVTMSVGYDHIDVEAAAHRHITVCNVPSYGPNTVAEHTIALLLALSRNIVPSVERTRFGNFDYAGLSGWDVKGRT